MLEGGEKDEANVQDSFEDSGFPLGMTIDENDDDIFRLHKQNNKAQRSALRNSEKGRKSELESELLPESRPKSVADTNSVVSGHSTDLVQEKGHETQNRIVFEERIVLHRMPYMLLP